MQRQKQAPFMKY